jgi:hypothetical protein
MGIWGYNNFESDGALDVFGNMINQIADKIREVFTYESDGTFYRGYGDSHIIANIDILGTLYEQYKIYHDLRIEEVIKWKENYLDTFDRITKNDVEQEGVEFNEKRREVIKVTFDRLINIMKEIDEVYSSHTKI